MQIQNNKPQCTPAFGSYKILTETFQYLSPETRPIVQKTISSVESKLAKISKGVKLEIGVKQDDPSNVYLSFVKRKFFRPDDLAFLQIPVENIDKKLGKHGLESFLTNFISAFKDVSKMPRLKDPISKMDLIMKRFDQPLK